MLYLPLNNTYPIDRESLTETRNWNEFVHAVFTPRYLSTLPWNKYVSQSKSQIFGPHIVSIAVGTAIFFIFYGPAFLAGTSPYLAVPVGDIAAEMAGYYHFAADDWHFPIFVMPHINLPEGSNALFTGGVPLLALFAKINHTLFGWTPDLFGEWYLLCCMLQAHSFFFLMRQMTDKQPFLLALASVLGGLAYAFLTRTGHVSLFCHFFCIYSVALVISTTHARYRPATILIWSAGLVYASMFVFAYLAICNTVMFVATVGSLWQLKKIRLSKAIWSFTLFGVVLLALAFIGGYFWAVGKATPSGIGGFSVYGLNIGSLIDPPQSILFPSKLIIRTWWEGDFYLGMGIVGLWLLIFLSGPTILVAIVLRYWMIAAVLGLLTLYSLSTRISFLDWTLVDIPPPKFLTPVLGMARTAGRLFWPVGYLLMAGAVAMTLDRFSKVGVFLVFAVMLSGTIEATGTFDFVRGLVTTAQSTPFDYSGLQKLANNHTSMEVYPTPWCASSASQERTTAYQQIELSSARAGLTSNNTITARQIKDCKAEDERAQAFKLKPDQLLVIMDRASARAIVPTAMRDEFLRHCHAFKIDGEQGLMCSLSTFEPRQVFVHGSDIEPLEVTLPLDSDIQFAAKSNRDQFILGGWSVAESEFTWSEGPSSTVEFRLPEFFSEYLSMEADVYPYMHGSIITERVVKVIVGDEQVAAWTFKTSGWQLRTFNFPPGLKGQIVRLTFCQSETRSPAELGGGDPRHLGLAVKRITLKKKTE